MLSAHLTMVDNVPWSTLIQRPWSDTIATTLSTMVRHGWQWKTMVPWSSCRRGSQKVAWRNILTVCNKKIGFNIARKSKLACTMTKFAVLLFVFVFSKNDVIISPDALDEQALFLLFRFQGYSLSHLSTFDIISSLFSPLPTFPFSIPPP